MDIYMKLKEDLLHRCPSLEVREEEPMSRHTSFRIGGPARLMALPKSEEEAIAAVECAARLGIQPFFMGNGSNLLVADQGYEGFIVKAAGGLDALERVGETGIRAGSGVLLSRLAVFAREMPVHTSSLASTRATFRGWRRSSRAIKQPSSPPPSTATS